MRLLPLLLAFAMLFPAGCRGEETVLSVSFSVPSAWGSRNATLSLDERWFTQDARQYHHGLARLSLAMAVSAFRGDAADPGGPILRFFSSLGFRDDSGNAPSPAILWDYAAPGENTVGTAIGRRELTCFETPVTLIAVAVCGGNYGDEWTSNLDMGLAGGHQGFSRDADTVLRRLRAFREANGLAGGQCLYWLAGFGRGGAVCDAAAALLQKETPHGGIFCYTFASPCSAWGSPEEQTNTFNIVAASDALAMMPPSEWGFTRYGRTLYLPSSLDTRHDYAALLPGFSQVYGQFTGQAEDPGDRDLAPMARAAASCLASQFQNRASYQRSWQALLCKILTGKTPGPREALRAYSLLSQVSAAARSVQTQPLPAAASGFSLGVFSSRELSCLFTQHDPALYAAWMLSLPQGNVLLDSSLTLTEQP